MEISQREFFRAYQKDYHKIKVTYLCKLIEDFKNQHESIFEPDNKATDKFAEEDILRTIKGDLRQTYFHAIETFFELFFALKPENLDNFLNENLLFKLANSKGRKTYDGITEIANKEDALDFLDNEILIQDFKVSIGQYLFYPSFYSKIESSNKLKKAVQKSIDAIKYGMRIIAKDFINREEYNAYKHGLRLIPSLSKFYLADKKTKEINYEWDISDSVSFYLKSDQPDEFKLTTKLFDFKKDYRMTYFCSNLIHNLIYFRKIQHMTDDEIEGDQIPIQMFGKKAIDECREANTDWQDLTFTIKKI